MINFFFYTLSFSCLLCCRRHTFTQSQRDISRGRDAETVESTETSTRQLCERNEQSKGCDATEITNECVFCGVDNDDGGGGGGGEGGGRCTLEGGERRGRVGV